MMTARLPELEALFEPRCRWCGRMLAMKVEGRAEIVCHRCHRLNTFDSAAKRLTSQPDYVRLQAAKIPAG